MSESIHARTSAMGLPWKALPFVAAAVCLRLCCDALLAAPPHILFPRDEWVLDARLDLGAKGDGVADDTEALQRGLDLSSGHGQRTTKALYLPRGTYRVTRSLVVKSSLGPWLYGESRDETIIRLDDGVQDVTAVLRTHPNESGATSADWFMRNVRNLSIDAGDNPHTDGIRYFATNTGILQNVRVTGRGKIGINAGFLGQSGPNLVQDTIVDGFDTGLLSQWIWGQTLSRVTLRNCRRAGLVVRANSVAAEDLVVENVPEPIRVEIPNDWHWWGGVLALSGGELTGDNPDGPAIHNQSVLYARDVKTRGFMSAVGGDAPGGNVAGPEIEEYSSHPAVSLFGESQRPPRLPVQAEPKILWETDPDSWLCVNDFGAVAGDNQDDTEAIRKAFNAAADQGKTTVYFRGCGGNDPNWYNLNGEIALRGNVRHVLGLGWARILGDEQGRFIVSNDSAHAVKFQNIDSFGGPGVTLENRSDNRSLVVESCGVKVLGTGQGDIFATDCPIHIDLRQPGQKMFCRQLNPEGNSDEGLVKNNGGDLWILGLKCEGAGVRIRTSGGGRTEALGTFIYGPGIPAEDQRPMFDVEDGTLTLLGLREISFAGGMYNVKVRERHGDQTDSLGILPGHGWIGWSMYRGRNQRAK